MNHSEASWGRLIDSIEMHRDIRARYFKPTCIVVVCDLLDRGVGSVDALSSEEVVAEFNRLVSNVFPKKSSQGWMPMWHLMRDGAWVCKKNGVPTQKEVFPLTKPRSKNQALNAVDSIDCSIQFGELWGSRKSRKHLRLMMCSMLLSDQDKEANLMGEFLRTLNADIDVDEVTLDMSLIGYGQSITVENYARFRLHTRIERSAKIPKQVKRLQGFDCLACGFNFKKVYGALGENYIEAHHIVPVAERRGTEQKVNLIEDFVVLCSNCHKMIHRLGEPWSRDRLNDLKKILSTTKV